MNEHANPGLVAVVSADVVGYSRLMGEDEAGTLQRLMAHRSELIDPLIERYGGRIVKTTGDGLLLEFTDATAAVSCAVQVQNDMVIRNDEIAAAREITFRIGINLARVIHEGDDIFGDGVNIAARLEGLAEPGGVLVSQTVYEAIHQETNIVFADNGELHLKNITQPVRAWSWPRQLPADRQDRKPYILVGEFKGRSEDENAFSEDLRDELTAALSRLTGSEVTIDPHKADYQLRGGVRLSKSRCRLSVQLLSAEDERQIWAERYDENSDDVFEILDRCVPRISIRVRRQVASDDAEKLAGKNLDDLTVEQLLSLSGATYRTPTLENWTRAAKIAERALEKAPKHFMALCLTAIGGGLAEAWCGYRRPEPAAIELAMQRTEEGLRQTNKSDVLIVNYSALLLYFLDRHEEAAAAAERSLQLNPDYNMGLWCLGVAKIFSGDPEAGIELAVKAYNVDIRDPYVNFYCRAAGYGYFAMASYQEAVDWFARAAQLSPGAPHNLIGLAASQWHSEDHDNAKATVARLVAQEPELRLADIMALPFRDQTIWQHMLAGLSAAGAPE